MAHQYLEAGQVDEFVEMMDFLQDVDSHCQRSEIWLEPIAKCLEKNDVLSKFDMIGLKVDSLVDAPTGGKGAFLQRAVDKANREETQASLPKGPERSTGMESFIQMLKKEDPKEHVDLKSKQPRMTMEDTDSSCLPERKLVDDIASNITRLKKKGIRQPFIYVDLAKYVPFWAQPGASKDKSDPNREEILVSDEVKGMAKVFGVETKSEHKLTLIQWMAAFDRYAIAAAANGQLTMPQALAHKNLVLNVCWKACAGGRRTSVGLFYDELVRKDWAARAYHGDETLNLRTACKTKDKDLLEQAEGLYDEETKKSRSTRKPWWNDQAKGHWNNDRAHYGKRPFATDNKFKNFGRDWKKARTDQL